jgi:hypothetical protein
MSAKGLRRAGYRVRQFFMALVASIRPLTPGERGEAFAYLPRDAWPLFDAMPRADQRHSLSVMRALRDAGPVEPAALLQAALLHDCAKRESGVRIWHRVAMVLLKAFSPALLARWTVDPAPDKRAWRYPLWAHRHHPERGAVMAGAAGCDPLAVELIRRHQDSPPYRTGAPLTDRLLVALQAADDDN